MNTPSNVFTTPGGNMINTPDIMKVFSEANVAMASPNDKLSGITPISPVALSPPINEATQETVGV